MQSNVVWHESRIQPARIEPLVIQFHTAQYFLEYSTESCEEKSQTDNTGPIKLIKINLKVDYPLARIYY